MSAKVWTYTAGKRPHRVTIAERGGPGGMLWASAWNPKTKLPERVALGHRDRDRAKVYAAEMHAKLMAGKREIDDAQLTLSRLFSLYAHDKTPTKSVTEQKADDRRMEMWVRVLGSGRKPNSISTGLWERFVRNRRAGSIDSRGRAVGKGDCQSVSNRTIEADCKWLRTVMNWAMNYRTGWNAEKEKPTFLLKTDPLKGLEIPHGKNPKRPVATRDRYEAIRTRTDDVRMEIRWEGRREDQQSYLSEVFDLAMATGRRISSVCQLRNDDLQLDRGPFGFVRWRADTDKQGRESVVAIDEEARAAIDRQLARRLIVGQAYVFPSPTNPDRPMSRHLADAWLRRAETLAGVESQEGSLWHAYRRGWATARKHLPGADVAELGGWGATETMEKVYQQADTGTMIAIVSTRHELREAK